MDNADHGGQSVEEEVDVQVILNVSTTQEVQGSLDALRSVGLRVLKVDAENGMVEGVVAPKALEALKHLPVVKYARPRFAYIAEAPMPQADGSSGDEMM